MVVALPLAWLAHRAINRWRLFAVAVVLMGAAGLSVTALIGLRTEFANRFSPSVDPTVRVVCALGAMWAVYIAFDIFRTWRRIGDKHEDKHEQS